MQRAAMLGLSAALVATGVTAAATASAAPRDDPAVSAFTQTSRSTPWRLADRVALDFPTYHPQGFAVVGDRIVLSAVEVLEQPQKYPEPIDGYDRSTGRGVGHVLVLTRDGQRVADVQIGEATMYHPGGIDFDGTHVWVPVAEYRPNSRSVVYRMDPETLKVTESFRVDDHIGGVVRDRQSGHVHGVSWGSRTLYEWTAAGRRLATSANPDHMLDYQDCAFVGSSRQLCSGVTGLPTADGGTYELGGLALQQLGQGRVLHEVPFPFFSSAGHVATRNPVAFEVDGPTMRLLAAPDDGDEGSGTELLVYEAPVGS